MKKYILKTRRDNEILNLCNNLLKLKLSNTDKDSVKLIKSQLETDWRKHLIIELEKVLKKYKIKGT